MTHADWKIVGVTGNGVCTGVFLLPVWFLPLLKKDLSVTEKTDKTPTLLHLHRHLCPVQVAGGLLVNSLKG